MSQIQMPRASAGKVLLGIVLALAIGALLPVVLTLQVAALMPVVLIGGVMMVFLCCFGGWIPACVLLAAQLASTAFFMGSTIMWMVLAAVVLPAVFVMRGIILRQKFFSQMRNALMVQMAGLIIAVFIAFMAFGSNMIAQMMDALRAQFAQMPDEIFEPFVDAINSAFAMMGDGAVPQESMMTVERYREMLMGTMLDVMQEVYVQNLPAVLLTGAAITAILSVLWGNWMMARRGYATTESFIGMSRWFLPAQLSCGLILMWVASYILAVVGYASGETVYVSIYMLVQLAFFVQALASIDRLFLKRGMRPGSRYALMTVILLASQMFSLFNNVLFIYGGASALFGSRGAIRLWMQKHQNDHTDSD